MTEAEKKKVTKPCLFVANFSPVIHRQVKIMAATEGMNLRQAYEMLVAKGLGMAERREK